MTAPSSRGPRARQRRVPATPRRVALPEAEEDLRPRGQRLVRQLALGAGVGHADRVLPDALAPVERPPGGAVRPGRAALLHRPAGAVPAGLHLPDRPADRLGLRAVPVHRGGRAAVVRLRLPADGLHRDLHVGRAQDRGRPHRPPETRRQPLERTGSWGARAPSRRSGSRSACGPASPSSATSRRSACCGPRRSRSPSARGNGSGCCSTASPPTATPASCASRCASTCAPTRASRARCSTRTR